MRLTSRGKLIRDIVLIVAGVAFIVFGFVKGQEMKQDRLQDENPSGVAGQSCVRGEGCQPS